MKNILEGPEIFESHATIAAGYFMIGQAQTEFEKKTPKDPISLQVDKATGYDKKRLDEHKKYISVCLIDIIEAKKVIEADYSKDVEFLQALNITN